MTHPLFSDRSFWYENPARPASSARGAYGGFYGDLGEDVAAIMRCMTPAEFEAARCAALCRGDFGTEEKLTRERRIRASREAAFVHLKFGGGR